VKKKKLQTFSNRSIRESVTKIINNIIEIVSEVNRLIKKYAPEEFKDKWLVNFDAGQVAVGSAKDELIKK